MAASMDERKLFHALSGKWLIFAVLGMMILGALVAAWWVTSPPFKVEGSSSVGHRSLTLVWGHPGDGSVTGYQYSTDHGVTWSDVTFSNGSVNFQRDIIAPAAGTASVILLRAVGTPGAGPNPPGGAQSTGAPVLAAQGTGPFSITLIWTKPTQGAGTPVALYEVDWSPDGSGGSWQSLTRLDQSDGNSYNDTGLPFETTRHYRVRAVDASFNYGPWSEAVSASTLVGAPNTPALSAEGTAPGTITLTWTEPSGAREGSLVQEYEIQWSSDGSDDSWRRLMEVNGDQDRLYEDYGPEPGETRYYRVRALDYWFEYSPWSATVSATAPFPAPMDPYPEVQTIGQNSVSLQWFEPYDGGSPIIRYELEASRNNGAFASLASNLSSSATSYMHTGLTARHVMQYRLRACHSTACSDWGVSTTVTVGSGAVPAAPVLTAVANGSSIIVLSWTQPDSGDSEITRYEAQKSEDGLNWDETAPFLFWPDTTTREHEGLSAGTTVYYRIRALNANGEGPWSDVASATTVSGAPAAPTELTASVEGDHRIDLSWVGPDSSAITGYRLERSTESHEQYELLTTTTGTSHSDTGLSAGTTYYYRVAATSSAGVGEYSDSAYATTTGERIGGEALTLTATARVYEGIKLTWSKYEAAPGGFELLHYELEWSTDGSSDWEFLGHANAEGDRTFVDDSRLGLTPGMTRHYRVRAVDYQSVHSPWSNVASATMPFPPPSSPSLIAQTVGRDTVYLEWYPADDGGKAIVRFELEAASNGGTRYVKVGDNLSSSTLSYLHTGLTTGSTMDYRMRACHSDDCSDWGTAPQVTVGSNAVPKAPDLKATTISAAIIEVSWKKPDNGGSAITGYDLQIDVAGKDYDHLLQPNDTAFEHDYLDAGTTVKYRIRALNGNGDGLWSDVVTAKTITGAPAAPELTVDTEGDHEINLRWDPLDEEGITYRLERQDNEVSDRVEWEVLTTTSETTYSDTGLDSGTPYTYRMVAANAKGMGPYSDEVYALTTGSPPGPPWPPVMLRLLSVSPGTMSFSWQVPVFDNGKPITGYQYQVTSDCEGWDTTLTATSDKQVTVTGLPDCSESYRFQVRAVNAKGGGQWASFWVRVPTADGGQVVVSTTALTITEGGTSQFTVKLTQRPTKDVGIYYRWEDGSDQDIIDAVDPFSTYGTSIITPDDWTADGVTFSLELAEDADATDGTALFHFFTYTANLPPPSKVTEEDYDPVYHGLSSPSVLITEDDND